MRTRSTPRSASSGRRKQTAGYTRPSSQAETERRRPFSRMAVAMVVISTCLTPMTARNSGTSRPLPSSLQSLLSDHAYMLGRETERFSHWRDLHSTASIPSFSSKCAGENGRSKQQEKERRDEVAPSHPSIHGVAEPYTRRCYSRSGTISGPCAGLWPVRAMSWQYTGPLVGSGSWARCFETRRQGGTSAECGCCKPSRRKKLPSGGVSIKQIIYEFILGSAEKKARIKSILRDCGSYRISVELLGQSSCAGDGHEA